MASLGRDLPLERVALGGLADDEVGELIRALEGRPSSLPLGSAMRHDTAGNPLFVGQLLRHLDESGVLVERDGELTLMATGRIGVPESARELVAARLAGLQRRDRVGASRGGGDRPLVRPRSSSRRWRSDRPSPCSTRSRPAWHAGLVEELDEARHAFVHALVREAIYDAAGAGRRAALHARVAEALEAARTR